MMNPLLPAALTAVGTYLLVSRPGGSASRVKVPLGRHRGMGAASRTSLASGEVVPQPGPSRVDDSPMVPALVAGGVRHE